MIPRLYRGLLPICLLLAASDSGHSMDRLRVTGDRIVDASGRSIVLHGVNVGEKSSDRGHRLWQSPEDFQNLRRCGMNAVRLLIFWSAIEPEPGKYDDNYLNQIGLYVSWARDADLYVILDMHQDLFSAKIPGGNGMPAWATLDDGQPHRTLGGVWSTAYYMSPMVHRAFDNLYADAPGPDGTGIQERFSLAWRHVARRFADEPAVAGFDLLNEPFIGSDISQVGMALLAALPDVLRDAQFPTEPGALLDSLSGTGGQLPLWVINALDDPACHRRALNVVAPFMRAFETGRLQPMYNRIARRIREVNKDAIIFLEPCVLANIGTPSFLEPLTDAQGNRDPQQAYMPHFYDIVVDTENAWNPSANRLRVMMENRVNEAGRLGMPLLVGEWGGYYGSDRAKDAARASLRELGANTVGDFYWEHHRNWENTVYFESLSRPLPRAVNGSHGKTELNLKDRTFVCSWMENERPAETEFVLPREWTGRGYAWKTGEASWEIVEHKSESTTIAVPPGKAGEPRVFTLSLREP